jgi:hypothetical protein
MTVALEPSEVVIAARQRDDIAIEACCSFAFRWVAVDPSA